MSEDPRLIQCWTDTASANCPGQRRVWRSTWAATAALIAVLELAACSQSPAPTPNSGVFSDADNLLDVNFGGGDQASPTDVDVKVDAAAEVTQTSCEFEAIPAPGQPGASCQANGECASNLCIAIDGGKICTAQCTDCCPTGFHCAQYGSGDIVFACIPSAPTACRPCQTDGECTTAGNDALCLDYGTDGRFCGGVCSGDGDCPTGMGCKLAKGLQGQSKQCVLNAGTCTCSKSATAQSAATLCSVTNANGTCVGQRSCGANGLSACNAATPAAETCGDSIDNNCNGLTDEANAAGCQTLWKDADADGFGALPANGGESQCLCKAVAPFTAASATDCDDAMAATNPGASEICNDIDDDCDGQTDEGCDADQDGYCSTAMQVVGTPKVCSKGVGDCNDGNANVHPGASEVCGNGLDDDCNGKTDDGLDATNCTAYFFDGDKDGYGTAESQCACGAIGLFSAVTSGDCDDSDASVHPGAVEVCGNGKDDNCLNGQDEAGSQGCLMFYVDADGDGYGADPGACLCAPDATYTAKKNGDCNDSEPKMNPAMTESCNGIDDNCDGQTDEDKALGCTWYYVDQDGDKWGNSSQKTCACAAHDLFQASKGGDCDDTQASVNPDAMEVCDGLDNNCNGATDEANTPDCKKFYVDADGDGYGDPATMACTCKMQAPATVSNGDDCNDANPKISPKSQEFCNGVDDNCNGLVDEENAIGCSIFFYDGDGDGVGVENNAKCLCGATPPYSAKLVGDCNDANPAIKPKAQEVCDSVDNDCDGVTDNIGALGCLNYFQDGDGDGYGAAQLPPQCLCKANLQYSTTVSGDCNDAAPAIHPGAAETCNGVDDDCNGVVDDLNALGCTVYFEDDDADSWGQNAKSQCACKAIPPFSATQPGDCLDSNPSVYPGAKEVCDGFDNNCNGITDTDSPDAQLYYADADSDGYGAGAGTKLCGPNATYKTLQAGDCNDANGNIHPNAGEICNGLDDNCNSQVDEGANSALCPSVANGAPICTVGKCETQCNSKWFDIDGQYGNGCECQADANFGIGGGACNAAVDIGSLSDTGSSATKQGNIVPGEAGDWYHFKAIDTPDTGGACDNFKVKVTLIGNPDGAYALDLYRGGCAGADNLCSNQQDTGWTVSFSGAPSGPGLGANQPTGDVVKSPSPESAGECKCTGAPGAPGMNICADNTADFYVRVYRPNGSGLCANYTLQVSNGL